MVTSLESMLGIGIGKVCPFSDHTSCDYSKVLLLYLYLSSAAVIIESSKSATSIGQYN